MEEEPSTKFCGVDIIFHKVMKLKSLVFNVSDVIFANGHNISPPALSRTCAYQGIRNVSFTENFSHVLNE